VLEEECLLLTDVDPAHLPGRALLREKSLKKSTSAIIEMFDSVALKLKLNDAVVTQDVVEMVDCDIDQRCFGVYQLSVYSETRLDVHDFFGQNCHILLIEKTAAVDQLSKYFVHSEDMLCPPEFPADDFALRICPVPRKVRYASLSICRTDYNCAVMSTVVAFATYAFPRQG